MQVSHVSDHSRLPRQSIQCGATYLYILRVPLKGYPLQYYIDIDKLLVYVYVYNNKIKFLAKIDGMSAIYRIYVLLILLSRNK